ncbi:MAG TPA: hypothetical protein VF764_04325 [Steroidobacteraceae bacterium]
MAALNFPNAPTTNQQWSAPNGAVYTFDGAVWTPGGPNAGTNLWTSTGPALTPTDPTDRVTIPGPTTDPTDNSSLVLGTATGKSRLTNETTGRFDIMSNLRLGPSYAWTSDDSTKAAWLLGLDCNADALTAWRGPPTSGTQPLTRVFWVDNVGRVILSNDPTNGAMLMGNPGGSSTARMRLSQHTSAEEICLSVNRNWPSTNVQDDTTKPAWGVRLAADSNDNFLVQRAPANSTTQTSMLALDNAGNETIPGILTSKFRGIAMQKGSNQSVGTGVNAYINGFSAISQSTGFSTDGQQVNTPTSVICLVVVYCAVDASGGWSITLFAWNGSGWSSRGVKAGTDAVGQAFAWLSDSWGGAYIVQFNNLSGATRTISNLSWFSVACLGQV